ncbi:hypothetical protein D9615_005352 [Tricholomella constricta]|uniref:Uncharacterized protein n=1 Tax=Tricholomella constricta TaxID=117010 RepID=A0A8H5M1R8_9AGAR|nr:hypothetical protein D9615_005352 [Tricholomella constricta]
MFLSRTIQQTGEDVCGPDRVCVPTMAIVGTDPIERENNKGGTGPVDFEKPGPHRYIGIGMVVGLVLVVLILYLAFGRWPRRKMRAYGWLKQKPESEVDEKKACPSPRIVDEIILPKQPEKVTTREARGPRRSRRTLEPWETEINYRVRWEMQQHAAYYEPEFIRNHSTEHIPPDKRSQR